MAALGNEHSHSLGLCENKTEQYEGQEINHAAQGLLEETELSDEQKEILGA